MLINKKTKKFVEPCAGSFAGMMELYENNYILIRQLCGDLSLIPDHVSATCNQNQPELVLKVAERSPYTLTLQFYYTSGYTNANVHLPSFSVRIYFDARQAETHEQLQAGSLRSGSSLQRRWDDNLLLFKWLAYWRKCGYSFFNA